MNCDLWDAPDVELFFYGELDEIAYARVGAHLRSCAACRQRLDDLRVIRRALGEIPAVDAPPADDWSGFMRRLDGAIGAAARTPLPRATLERTGGAWRVRHLAALAATLVIAASGVFMAARVRHSLWLPPSGGITSGGITAPGMTRPGTTATGANPDAGTGAGVRSAPPRSANLTPVAALRDVSAEHLERSKLVVLGLAARDPLRTQPADWQYERRLAGSLLADTRLYRVAAQQRGASDVAHVMRDLETVLLEASMSEHADRESLERVQRLIARRGLVTKMQLVTTAPGL